MNTTVKPSRTDYKAVQLTSPAFHDKGHIPEKYTCEGENISPPLQIGDVPFEAKSLVLIVDDPDAPSGTWLHWIVWNIPITHKIAEDDVPGIQGINDFGRNSFGGPCPPSGTHRYFFRVYALDDTLSLPEGSNRKQVAAAMRDHILGYGELMGVFSRSRR